MEKFSSIYLFTTENIAGYMKYLDLTGKRIITVTGSSDHIINAILKGCIDITTFDVNPITKYYMDLKLTAIKELSYNKFLDVFLYDSKDSFSYNIISNLNMPEESKLFWLQQLEKYNNNGLKLKKSDLFNTKYFNPNSKLWQNMYLTEENYNILKQRIENVKIKFINNNIIDLKLEEYYEYMFLSNISDYLNLIYDKDLLESYKKLLFEFLEKVKIIYFAYLYDIENSNPRSEIDDLSKVRKIFNNFYKVHFKSALEVEKNNEKTDGVLILKRGGKENVRK